MQLLLWIYYLLICSTVIFIVLKIMRIILKLIIGILNNLTPNRNITVDVEISDPQTIAQLDNLEQQLEITNAQIQQQQQLLEYTVIRRSSTYDEELVNELDGDVLKIRSNILKLSAKSDKIGFQINKIGSDYYDKIHNNRRTTKR